MKKVILITFIVNITFSFAQTNCFIYPEGSGERKACELSYKAIEHKQGSRESQILFDSAIAIGPKFAWAYYEKSVPYFKRGFLYEGLQILNKAIELEPIEYLCYRAYWYWQYKNYELCIQDLETYYALPKAYIQFTPGGEKDMRIILALAYAKTGNYKKGVEIINSCLNSYESDSDAGLSDYYSLGIIHFHNKEYNKATEAFIKQLEVNGNMADTYYFLGLAYKNLSNIEEAKIQFNKALSKFEDINRNLNINAGYKAYLSDVVKEIESLKY